MSERLEVTADRVVAGLLSEAEGKDDSTASSRVAAWAHLGRHLGMDNKGITLRIDQPRAEDMAPAELEAELDRLQAELAALDAKEAAMVALNQIGGRL